MLGHLLAAMPAAGSRLVALGPRVGAARDWWQDGSRPGAAGTELLELLPSAAAAVGPARSWARCCGGSVWAGFVTGSLLLKGMPRPGEHS